MLRVPTFLEPTKKLEKRPPFTIAKIILLNVSITITNRKEDNGSPCLKPRDLLKKAYQTTPSLPQTSSPQHIQQKIPINVIISLFNIQLA
jgi:hypothetical protein